MKKLNLLLFFILILMLFMFLINKYELVDSFFQLLKKIENSTFNYFG